MRRNKPGWHIATALFLYSSATSADVGTEIGKGIGRAASSDTARSIQSEGGKVAEAATMTALCESEGSFADSALCFETPSGKLVWELKGSERAYWLEIGKEHQEETIYRKQREQKIQEERIKQQVDSYKIKLQLCKFWREQAESDKKKTKEEEYCNG